MDHDKNVQHLNAVRAEMQALHAGGMPYAQIAKRYGLTKGTAWRIIEKHHEPKDPAIREKLGLEPCLTTHTQYHSVRRCSKCGRPFIPNTAKRRRCFECTPFRRRKK